MHSSNETSGSRLILRLLLVVGVVMAAVALAACGSSNSSSSSTTESTETEETEPATSEPEGASGSTETTVYAKGVPTLAELYEGSEEEPPTSGPKAVAGKSMIVVSAGEESEGARVATEYLVEAGTKIGWKASNLDGKLNVNNGYSNAIRTAIASKPDAIVLVGINCPEVKTSLEEVKSAKIPLFSYAGLDCGTGSEELFTMPQEYNKNAGNAEESYEEYGEFMAAYAINATEGKGKIIQTTFTAGFGEAIAKGQETVLAKCTECEVVENVEFEPAETAPGGLLYSKFETALTKYPEANAALITFDSLATAGLSKAIVDSGRSDEIFAVAAEGHKETLRLIREGAGLNAEGAASSTGWTAWGLVDNINRFFAGEPSVPPGVGFVSISKEKNMPPAGQNYETSVEYKPAYEKIWSGK